MALLGKGPAALPTVVYVTQQKTAAEVAAALQGRGIEARPYHAGLGNDARAANQAWFMSEGALPDGARGPVVVATVAFGMGVDKADVRRVVHYNAPRSLEA